MKSTEDELIDLLMQKYEKPEDLWSKDGILKNLKKRFAEKMLEQEMEFHLGYKKHDTEGNNSGNSRNGHSKKTIKTDNEELELSVPRDRNSSFEPQLVEKGKTRLKGFDDQVIALYSRGLTTGDIRDHLEEIYGTSVSKDLISTITDTIFQDVLEWQNRPLDMIYPIVYLDAISVKIRHDGKIINKSVYLALGVNMEGKKELLGMWISENEGANFWLGVVTELQNRGVKDILIACVDGLKGFPEAIRSVFPKTEIQLCIVHMVRNSIKYSASKDQKKVIADLKKIYKAQTLSEAEQMLDNFEDIWGTKYPIIVKSWRSNWENIIPFFDYTEEIRRAIYTTNAIESVNSGLRKVIKNRKLFPTDKSVMKIFYLAINNLSKKWTMPIQNWSLALNQLTIKFEDRLD